MADRVGQQLGNYRLIHLLGQGGFADVYLGEHVYLQTQAAIKVLQVRLAKDDLQAFLSEARTVARLVHPHIIRVLEFGVDGNIPFLVMDYAPNGTLRQRHPKGTVLPLATILQYIKQISAALQYAHDEKLIHRDIKPENMLLARNNHILLSDFGIATVAHSTQSQSIQEVMGTAPYMAPEQLQGKPRPASDQYSLGIVIYEWLSGDRPFRGTITELYTQHLFVPPPSLREKLPGISPAIEQVLMVALAKDPQQRFISVQAFANALEQASRSEPTVFYPLTVTSPISPLALSEPHNAPTSSPVLPTLAIPLSTPSSSPSTPHDFPLPGPITQPKYRLSRRAILAGLAGLATASAGIAWLVLSQKQQTSSHVSTPVSSATLGVTKIPSAGLRTPGTLQWGADFVGGAPYVYQDSSNPNQLVGFEVEIAVAIANLMGITQKQVETDYGHLEQALLSNQFDMVMNGWEKTPDREKTEIFSQAYYRYGQQIVVRTDDSRFAGKTTSDNLSLKDLDGLTVGTGASYKAADILGSDKAITTKLYDPNLPFNDLAAHMIDAVLIDGPIVAYYVLGAGPGATANPALKPIGKPFETSDYFVSFNKANPKPTILQGEIDQALDQLKKDGTLKRIYMRWSMWNDQQAQIGTM